MPATEVTPTNEELVRRIHELEAELARTKTEKDLYKTTANALGGVVHPYVPMTPEEIHDMLHGPRGKPISEIIAELEAESGEVS